MTTDAPATTQRVIKMAAHPIGALKDSDFELVDAPVPEPADGEALVRTLYLSLDPAIRVWMNGVDTYVPGIHVGDVMRAGGLGEVVRSRNPAYSEGDLVFGMMQWSDYCIAGAGPEGMMTVPRQEPITAFLSVYGVTGLTAYFGMFDVGQAKEGETVVVSGAAGAVGSIAGQIGKIIGCRVVGIAGGPEKCAWLTDELGFDAWIDYKSEDVSARLR
jgi:NADPH-dependent curcumin reductase